MKKKIWITLLLIASASISTVAISVVGIYYSKSALIKPNTPPPTLPDTKPPIVVPPENLPPGWDDIDKNYFKEKAFPITNGVEYSFATPGTGNNFVVPSYGPQRTEPSKGVPENATVKTYKLITDTDVNLAKKSFSLVFRDNSYGTHLGTGWILDFKLTNDGSYPLTWYIASNAHVIQNLKVKNDIMTPERYNTVENFYNTSELIMFNIVEMSDYKSAILENTLSETSFQKAIIKPTSGNKQNLKTIFIGNDFLKTSPEMFSTAGIWSKSEEYADFAVMEVTFNNEQEAKNMTHNYATNFDQHFKYKKESLVKNQNHLNNNDFTVFGFPAIPDPDVSNTDSIPTINRNNSATNEGGKLGTSNFYQTFTNIKSAFDAALGLSFFGYNYRYFNPERPDLPNDDKYYNSWGLMYPVDYGNLGPGSSGSMLLDKNGFTWGIHFAADNRASTGLAQALYCEGFNYQGLFGIYNLEGYDLIEGGFPNQKNSYRDSLIKLYGKDLIFKTNLFKNGVNR